MTNDDQRNHFDEWIDDALSAYSAAEPVHGLEERVWRRIDGDHGWRTKPWQGWLRFAVPVAAVLVIGFVGVDIWQKPMPQPRNTVPLLETGHAAAPASSAQRRREQVAPRPRVAAIVPVARRLSSHAETLAKKQVFPTPTPLTKEEEVLVSWAIAAPMEVSQAFEALHERSEQPVVIQPIRIQPLTIDGLK
jgi:hypothetical protein